MRRRCPRAAGRANSGNAFASFLLGAVDNASYNGLYVVPGLRYQYKALFAQDDWKISRKLTLNLGLRWDLFTPRHEHNTNISGFDPSLPNPGAGNLLGAIRFLGNGPGRDNTRAELRRHLLQGVRAAHRIRLPVGGRTRFCAAATAFPMARATPTPACATRRSSSTDSMPRRATPPRMRA